VKTIFLARRLRQVWKDQQTVGVLLPPSIGAHGDLAAISPAKFREFELNGVERSRRIGAEQSGLTTTITSRHSWKK